MSYSKSNYGIKRLESKNARNAIIQKLSSDFNLTPIIAEAFYKQIDLYFQQHANISLSSGEIAYMAVAAEEPAGKSIRVARKVTVRLRLYDDFNTDLEVLASYGLAGLRRHRLARITKQAYDQSALLSYEDIAMMLTTSPVTVRRDVYQLRNQGMFIMTRGTKHDMGLGSLIKRSSLICISKTILSPILSVKRTIPKPVSNDIWLTSCRLRLCTVRNSHIIRFGS